jgi:hypothetical protein
MVSNYSLPLKSDAAETKRAGDQKKCLEGHQYPFIYSALENTLDKLRNASTLDNDLQLHPATWKSSVLKVRQETAKGNYNIKVTQLAVAQTAISNIQNVADP